MTTKEKEFQEKYQQALYDRCMRDVADGFAPIPSPYGMYREIKKTGDLK